MTKNKEKGDLGELWVEQFLCRDKYTIIARNYRKKFGEIDIIAKKDNVIAIVEVKTRKTDTYIRGALAVNYKKKVNIVKTTQMFILESGIDFTGMEIRFDIAEVIISKDSQAKVLSMNYFDNAFDASGMKDIFFI